MLWSKRGYFVLLGNNHILVYYHIIPYQRIKVYRVETMDMEIFRWNNGVSGKCNPSKYCGIYCTGWEPFGRIHTVLNNDILRTHHWHIEPYIELRTILSKIFVLCLMEYYHIINKTHPLEGFIAYYLCFLPVHTFISPISYSPVYRMDGL